MNYTFDYWLNQLLGENNWVAYCINLEAAQDRKKNFTKWAKEEAVLTFKFWGATDKNFLTPDDYNVCDVIVNNEFKSPGATACRLSHQRLFQHLLNTYPNQEYFLVFEDDCGFKNKSDSQKLYDFIRHVIEYNTTWDSIVFGYHNTGYKMLAPLTQDLVLVQSSHLAHATIYKRSALENLLYLCKLPQFFNMPIDWITDALRQFKSITLGPSATIIDQVDEFSYICFSYGDTSKGESKKIITVEDLMRCCVQFPVTLNGKTELRLNINTLYADVLFLPHTTIKSFVTNSRHLKNPVVVVAYDEKNVIAPELLSQIEECDKILALFTNNLTKSGNKLIELDIVNQNDITYWKRKFDSYKK